MKPSYLLLWIALFFITTAKAQTFQQRFKELSQQNDTAGQRQLLQQWQKHSRGNPEFYVAIYNFYAQKGLEPVLSLTTDQKSADALVIRDKNQHTVGYLGSSESYNIPIIQTAFKYIDTGINEFPSRLDMRFGKVFLLGKIRDYDKFTEEIIKAIDYGETIQNKWLWTDSQPLDDPEKFMLSTVQAYMVQLFTIGTSQNDHMRRITRTVLKYHPDNVENLSDLSITYIVDKRYPDALEALLKAEKIAPQDYIVLNNIAYCYAQLGNKADAIRYYEKVKQFGPGEEKQKAEQKIQELNN